MKIIFSLLHQMAAVTHDVSPALRTCVAPFDAVDKGVPLELSDNIWYAKTRMAGLQSDKGRMMINSVVLAKIHPRDRHTDRHTDRHGTIANVAPTHCFR